MEERKEIYNKKREKLEEECTKCRKRSYFKITPERCEDCTVGRKIRMLETEYSDVTGWSHKKW